MADLRRAVDRHEFSLRFQPVVRLDGERIIGAEALLRWEHPERATVSPEEFISLAEETGLILPIGRWVSEESCRRLAGWQRIAPELSELSMSVNISARQLTALGLDIVVRGALTANRLEPSRLVLEVTEGMLMDDVEFFSAALGAIRNTGAYDLAIVRAVITISEALNLAVVAEGVESEAQAEALLRLGCRHAQGYHFYRPLTGKDFEAALSLSPNRPEAIVRGPIDSDR
jgi:EAL domain-containing protein (putative c-di-GMP-specific phosphodiesterase class I)